MPSTHTYTILHWKLVTKHWMKPYFENSLQWSKQHVATSFNDFSLGKSPANLNRDMGRSKAFTSFQISNEGRKKKEKIFSSCISNEMGRLKTDRQKVLSILSFVCRCYFKARVTTRVLIFPNSNSTYNTVFYRKLRFSTCH